MERLINNEYLRKLVSEPFDDHLDLFTFSSDFSCPDVVNIANLVTLNPPTRSLHEVTDYNNSNISDKEEFNLSDSFSGRLSIAASLEGNWYKANFVSPKLSICLSETLLKMKLPSSQKFFKLFLPRTI